MGIEHQEICDIKKVGQAIKSTLQKSREIENEPDPKLHSVPTICPNDYYWVYEQEQKLNRNGGNSFDPIWQHHPPHQTT